MSRRVKKEVDNYAETHFERENFIKKFFNDIKNELNDRIKPSEENKESIGKVMKSLIDEIEEIEKYNLESLVETNKL